MQVQQVPLNLLIFGKETIEPVKLPRSCELNLSILKIRIHLNLSFLRPSDSPGHEGINRVDHGGYL